MQLIIDNSAVLTNIAALESLFGAHIFDIFNNNDIFEHKLKWNRKKIKLALLSKLSLT